MQISKFSFKNQNFCILFYTFVIKQNTMKAKYITLIIASLFALSCSTTSQHNDKQRIYVTINPLRSIVEELTCGDFEVEVLVPRGASPETFEPSAQQIAALNDANLVFKVGLIDFEQSMMANINDKQRVIDLSQGIEVMQGCCSHGHKHHTHGIDPHIWCAPRTLTTMVKNMHAAIKERYADSTKYDTAAEAILRRLSDLDKECAESIERSGVKSIMIYHPAYTYMARDYGIEQIAIEQEGKEPTPKQLRTLIDKARSQNVGVIFHQPQYNANKLNVIASESGAEIVVTDPLADDIVAEIENLIKLVCNE